MKKVYRPLLLSFCSWGGGRLFIFVNGKGQRCEQDTKSYIKMESNFVTKEKYIGKHDKRNKHYQRMRERE